MRKILIVALLAAIFTGLEAICACPIDGLLNGQKSCTVGLQDQGQTIQDKLMPNNLNQMVNPQEIHLKNSNVLRIQCLKQ